MHWADAVLMTRRDAAAMLELGALAVRPSHEHSRIDILERSLYSLHTVSSVVFLENIKLTVLCFCSRFLCWVCAAVQRSITRTFDIGPYNWRNWKDLQGESSRYFQVHS